MPGGGGGITATPVGSGMHAATAEAETVSEVRQVRITNFFWMFIKLLLFKIESMSVACVHAM
jgi:hypothetical protein